MNQPADVTRLISNWLFWSVRAGLTNPSVSAPNAEAEIHFVSDEYSVHLRHADEWWVMDTIDDRGQAHENVARFSSYELAEKFLLWEWSSAARNALRLTRLGPDLYARGIDPKIEAVEINTGTYELRTTADRAVLMEPSATIFSHLMSKSVDEIDAMVKAGLAESYPNSN